jgi:sterol desaturase/sphingolipid hydroxylase (fatty acid hydroxylase superfamily)
LGFAGAALSGSSAVMALLLVIIGVWETLRPDGAAVEPAGRRWISNIAMFVVGEGAWFALAPLLSITALSILPPSPTRSDGSLLHFGVMLLLLDFCAYFLHRASHRFGWLWRLHAIHHSDTDLDLSTTLRHHPAEFVVAGLVFASIAWVAGASPNEMAAYAVLEFGVQLLAHANVALPARGARALGFIIVLPDFHRFHHSRDIGQSNTNYGQVLAIWDRLFGTIVARDRGARPAAYGVEEFLAPRFATVPGMLLQPFTAASTLPAARRAGMASD